ncbi:TetR/AcrR family transcriptional regulator [Plantactinospora mayteni]|uniref:TetR family transcriptional regulator n=1 Tax=Plantactinospora mayteni TaxID=566021 RepID=A0ABQ4F435_9ACTN|nr:TetR/AcrR family transcriptional regulator [Plantactinospora mayteni]GIH01637.1 TetR family transcriptional regulator [Plantactinospora mayteni]
MGHREQLLAGAKRCLYERGYARTTARDIVTASGTNLASIGYHFGSKEALLTAAMIEAMDEWGDELERAVTVDPDASPLDRLTAIWTGVSESVTRHRQLWAASVDLVTQVDHHPELRERLAAAMAAGRAAFTSIVLDNSGEGDTFGPVDGEGDTSVDSKGDTADPVDGNGPVPGNGIEVADGASRAAPGDPGSEVGALVMAVITGLSVQWLLDPEGAPSGAQLVEALRTLAAAAGTTSGPAAVDGPAGHGGSPVAGAPA